MKKILFALFVAAALSACCQCRSYDKIHYTPFEVTRWELKQIDGRNIASLISSQDMVPYLVFGSDGRVGGRGGCNIFGGEWSGTPSRVAYKHNRAGGLSFSNFFSTKMYCPDMKVEQEFLGTLETIDSYSIEGEYLYLFHDGELRLVLAGQAVK